MSKLNCLSQIVTYLTDGCRLDLDHLSENLAALGVPGSSSKKPENLQSDSSEEDEEEDNLREMETLGKLFLQRLQCAAKTGLQLAMAAPKKK